MELEGILGELVGTVQGIWSVISNYGGNSDGVQTWWEEQYGKLVTDGFEGSGATIVTTLFNLFTQFMPGTTVITTIVDTTV